MKTILIFIFSLSFLTPLPQPVNQNHVAEEVSFMREMISSINPSLLVEDANCAYLLPWAIHREAGNHGVDWRKVFVLGWQESDFDCHAKNKDAIGGAYGPFQIRRLWQPITGDPRHRYFDPELAAARVAKVLAYYQSTPKFGKLVKRNFKNPLLCLYYSGEPNRVDMKYCRTVGRKMKLVTKAWDNYREENLLLAAKSRVNSAMID